MRDTEKIEIPLSRLKISLLLIGANVFVITGVLFNIYPELFESILFRNKGLIRLAGLASVVFFGICGASITMKLFDKKPGLTINKQGIIDNSSGISAGLILWSDIKKIESFEVANKKFIKIIVSNPEAYIENQQGKIKKIMMRINYKRYDTPIQISANGLMISFDKLYNILLESWK